MKKTRDRMMGVGDQMANLCFNLSQSEKVESRNRQVMRELCSDWDHLRRLLRAEERKKKRTP